MSCPQTSSTHSFEQKIVFPLLNCLIQIVDISGHSSLLLGSSLLLVKHTLGRRCLIILALVLMVVFVNGFHWRSCVFLHTDRWRCTIPNKLSPFNYLRINFAANLCRLGCQFEKWTLTALLYCSRAQFVALRHSTVIFSRPAMLQTQRILELHQ